ncbi:hypothetical protein [Pseudoalteromonas denitrificans]|jgi:hypothetical protein|uniref:Uncharacterized protein n=1 Tax=Pseudoalteromonas denitrificans DSM 6059 TaxID=1123010 RepID=A0A1I1DYL7_9GAMM|nr:hypothetical protein [Pseudoalteromonas denitrificans]SFB79897.1 hypothetical protein SAMN02745724_00121 [Pseudoalteromonas denitrificans DSM 6059]
MESYFWVLLFVAMPSFYILWHQGRSWSRESWLLILMGTLLSILTGEVSMGTHEEINAQRIHLTSWFSVSLFLFFYIRKDKAFIQPTLMFTGSFLSLFIADIVTAMIHIPGFEVLSIGGAGLVDGLVVVPFFTSLMAFLILTSLERRNETAFNI